MQVEKNKKEETNQKQDEIDDKPTKKNNENLVTSSMEDDEEKVAPANNIKDEAPEKQRRKCKIGVHGIILILVGAVILILSIALPLLFIYGSQGN